MVSGIWLHMWNLIVHIPDSFPKTYEIGNSKTSIGRATTNDIVVEDVAASRQHAEIWVDEAANTISIVDLDSTNGTFINHKRISGKCPLKPTDVIRIGQVIFNLVSPGDDFETKKGASGTHIFTRELLLESIDQHAVLLYDVARKLNFATSLEMIVDALTVLIKHAMGVQSCEIIMKDMFGKFDGSGGTALALRAIKNRSAEVSPTEMYVPILSGDDILALMILKKERPGTRAFTRNHLQIAIAISHQASLTIQRMNLLEKFRKEEQIRQLFTRFVSPSEVKLLLHNYLETGELPPLHEEKVTVMFVDIAESTGMAEKMGVKKFADVLNHFYSDSADIIFKHNGMLKYLGDGVMAIFVDVPDEPAPEERAILSGRELLVRTKTTGHLILNQRIIMGVSINTGIAMVGYIGTRDRAEFNALGDVVNVAYRMQEYARPNRIVVGPATVAAIVDKFPTQRIGAVSLRGRESSFQVYEVLT
ncbi:MAG TPA: adenylate/guanylate cyclase domain-containing protein [Anaerolineales bacterium]|jgi:class 3 adenylate cyclase|nr:adenylate/guanylate cyclase domain-containing protein [Anaerolineales bacterium]